MTAITLGVIGKHHDLWGWLRTMANEQTGKMQLGFRDIGLVAAISIIGTLLGVGATYGRQSSALDFEREQRVALEKRVATLENGRTDLKDHDKLIELGVKQDQLSNRFDEGVKSLEKQLQDFAARQDRMTAYGIGAQNKGRP